MSKKIVAQDTTVLVGVDVHTIDHVVTVKSGRTILERNTVSPNPKAWKSYLERFPGCEMHIIYESGPHGYNLHDWLKELNGADDRALFVYIAPPANVPKAPGKKKIKTDRRDSLALIQAFECASFEPVVVPPPEVRAEREMTRTKEQLKQDITRIKNRIHAMFKFHGIARPGGKSFSEAWRDEALENAQAVDRTGAVRAALEFKFQLLGHAMEIVASVKQRIKKLYTDGARSRLAQALATQTGIGIESSTVIVNEVANFAEFKNSDAFASYTGLVPGAWNSGDTERSGHITREGNRRLRSVFVECAWTWVRFDPGAKARYERLKYRRGSRRAIVAMARRLAVIVYHLAMRHLAEA